MLNLICDSHSNFSVDVCEYGDDGRGHTYKTLCEIQKRNPDAEIYFICGADKLNIIPKWHGIDDLLTKFNIIVTARKGDKPHEQIANNIKLSKYSDKFILVEQPDELDEISSTEARAMINKNCKVVYDMCNPLVAEYIKELSQTGGKT